MSKKKITVKKVDAVKKSKLKKFSGVRFAKPEIIEFDRQEQGRTMSVSELPRCDHQRILAVIVNEPSRAKICVVAFRYPGTNCWNVMAGYPDMRDIKDDIEIDEHGRRVPGIGFFDLRWLCENVNDVQSVKMLGVKLPEKVALKLFPDWSILKYDMER